LDQTGHEVIECTKRGHPEMFPGAVAFKLYSTFGFPPDLTRILASERHLGFDETGFEQAMAEQQARSRAASKFERLDLSHHGKDLKETRFLGYAGTRAG